MQDGPVIALVDGEHHPAAVREALDRLEARRGVAGVVFCGGEEKLRGGSLDEAYGRPVAEHPEQALRRLATAATAVVDLADEPVLPASAKLRLAGLALHLGLAFECPGARLEPPHYEPVAFAGPKLAVIGTGKRTGKTALATHWAGLLRERSFDPVVVCMGRGGPAEPVVAAADTALLDLVAIAESGGHGASDYLEDAVLAGVRTVGCRRVGAGLAGQPAETNLVAGAALAASLFPGALIFEGSGACIPPVEVDRTVCVAGAGQDEPFAELRLLRADLVLAREGQGTADDGPPRARGDAAAEGPTLRFRLAPEPAEAIPEGARVALFTTGARACAGIEPVVTSTALARRAELAADLARAARERCDVYLCELKAAAIDAVARRARAEGARVVFVRNRPVGLDADLDAILLELGAGALRDG